MPPFFKYIIQKNEKVYKELTVIGTIILITLNIKKESQFSPLQIVTLYQPTTVDNEPRISRYHLYGAIKTSTDTTDQSFAYNFEVRDDTGLDYSG